MKHEPLRLEDRSPAGRTFALGDIHGCSTALRTLIEAIDPGPQDVIVTLGDYIDWGPDSREVIEELIALARRSLQIPLLGNHEEMLLAAQESRSEMRFWLRFGGEETINSYSHYEGAGMLLEEHLRFIRGCRDYFETDAHIFVHANYEHRLPMDRVGGTKLRWEHIDARVAEAAQFGQDGRGRAHAAGERSCPRPGIPDLRRHGLQPWRLADGVRRWHRRGDPGQSTGRGEAILDGSLTKRGRR